MKGTTQTKAGRRGRLAQHFILAGLLGIGTWAFWPHFSGESSRSDVSGTRGEQNSNSGVTDPGMRSKGQDANHRNRARPRPAAFPPLNPLSVQLSEIDGRLVMPKLDNKDLIAKADEYGERTGRYRFAEPIPVSLTPKNSGEWKEVSEGRARWTLRLQSQGATSLNLGFSQFSMPPGGRLNISSPHDPTRYRSFTARDNEDHGQLWTPLLGGDEVRVEVMVPRERREDLQLELAAINHGFRGWKTDKIGGGTSGNCNVDVICDSSDGAFANMVDTFRDQIRSVGAFTVSGVDTCTGALVNNTSGDGRPFFLTADHCGVNSGQAASVVTYWNFENSTCRQPGTAASGGIGNGNLTQFNTGTIFRAENSASDMTLLEMDDPIDPAFNLYCAGWNRSGNEATTAIGIHHPRVAEKRISFEFEATTTTSYSGTAVPGNGTHVRVSDWNIGTTEPGSSGSPLFDQNGRIIGQLHGGGAACGNDLSDWYGRFSVSWSGGGSNSTRLSNWLDPGNTGATSINGLDLGSSGDDNYEENDTLATAFNFTQEQTNLSSIDGLGVQSDDDWYEIFVTPGFQRVVIDCTFTHADGDIDIQLWDGASELARSQGTVDNEQIDFTVAAGGTYYIRVYFGDAGNSYNLRWDDLSSSGGDDNYEENDTLATAFDISSNESSRLSAIDGLGVQSDDDWYQIFVTPGFERVLIDCLFTHDDGDIDIQLWNGTSELARAQGTVDNEMIDFTVPPGGGTFYIRVYFGDNGNTYNLEWDDVPPPLPDDNYEENDDLAGAFDLSSAEGVALSSIDGPGLQADDDWYRISVSPGELQVLVDCTFTHADGDVDIALHNAAGTRLAVSNGVIDNESIIHTVDAPGDYYIRVYFGNAGNSYDLVWDALVDPRVPIITDIQYQAQPGNSAAVTLTWKSQPGAEFAVDYTTDLINWMEVANGIPAGPGDTSSFIDTFGNASTLPTRYWRVRQSN